MSQSILRCFHSVNTGLSDIRKFDLVLATGDLDGAADWLVDLWNKLYEPTQVLTNLYDGEFWRDWEGRAAFEKNLKEVYALLSGDEENDTTISALEEVRDYLHANFFLLKNAIKLLAVDVGMKGLRKITGTPLTDESS